MMDIDNFPYEVLVHRAIFDDLLNELSTLSISYQFGDVVEYSNRNQTERITVSIKLTSLEDYSFIKMKYS